MAGMWDQYKTNSDFANDVEDAIAETEQEIFDSAFDNGPDDNDFDESMEQVEGFDGEPLSADDMLEGPNENGYDRPASLRRDMDLMSQNERLQQERDQLRAQLDEVQNGPERQEQMRQQLREQLYEQFGVLATDDRIDGLIQQMAAQQGAMQQMQNDRVNQSMARAHHEYGADFERAFQSFTSMDQRNPTAQALARDVMSAADPGQRLMALHQGNLNGFNSTRGLHPDLGLAGARTAPVGGGRGGRDLAQEFDGFGNDDVENDIFRSVWDN